MRLRLDRERCVGHAQCHATAPEFFPIDDEGFSVVEDQSVPDDELPVVRAGVNACPERALILDDET
ncbi:MULTISPECIES: ferredoxin [Gordonia]|uniref:ferredoxin n=1 Tax=Gordonia TaxID=2053 RepID=UPI00133164DE|nr:MULTISPECIES: ferredoxin [Gordonia]KAF0969849.1 hypothetical protein BPODLACK_01538 [Gordonia sp. YY1]MCZ0913051.1 ferredoxin [Gordonia amicalis]UPW14529.1 ferredoxin [Gordonia amicalis]